MANPMTAMQHVGPSARGSTIQTRLSPVLRLSLPSGTLRLRAEPSEQRHIQWAEDVIDNEGMGKKSSKGNSPPQLPLPIFTTPRSPALYHPAILSVS